MTGLGCRENGRRRVQIGEYVEHMFQRLGFRVKGVPMLPKNSWGLVLGFMSPQNDPSSCLFLSTSVYFALSRPINPPTILLMREDKRTRTHARALTHTHTRMHARTHAHTHMQVGTDSRTGDSNDDGARRDEGSQPYQISGMS